MCLRSELKVCRSCTCHDVDGGAIRQTEEKATGAQATKDTINHNSINILFLPLKAFNVFDEV